MGFEIVGGEFMGRGEVIYERGFWFGVWGLRLLGRVYEGRGR